MTSTNALSSLIFSGTKLWLDSVDPALTTLNRDLGVTGATSNPIIIADLIKSRAFDHVISSLKSANMDAEAIAWAMTDRLVSDAEQVFRPIFDRTSGDDGYVSFELNPLLEDSSCLLSPTERANEYVALAKKWSSGHPNRMIKVPATEAGILAMEDIVAAGIPLNVTLIFSLPQYERARTAVWKGAQRLKNLSKFKSVFSIFVSRVDVYAESHYPQLAATKEGLVGIINAKRIWKMNQDFWKNHPTPLKQEMIFASTGTKNPKDRPWKYVEALAGSDIQTNPPTTNDAAARSGVLFAQNLQRIDQPALYDECIAAVDWVKLERDLMTDGLKKFADPHKALIAAIAGI